MGGVWGVPEKKMFSLQGRVSGPPHRAALAWSATPGIEMLLFQRQEIKNAAGARLLADAPMNGLVRDNIIIVDHRIRVICH